MISDTQAQLAQLQELFDQGFIPESEFLKRKDGLTCERDNCERIFRYFDNDSDNRISFKEFQNLLTKLGELVTESQAKVLFSLLDLDKDGFINFNELYSWWKSPSSNSPPSSFSSEEYCLERLNLLKLKLTSHSFMSFVMKEKVQQEESTSSKSPSPDEDLTASISIEIGDVKSVSASIFIKHHRDPEKAQRLRELAGKGEDPTSAVLTLAFQCKEEGLHRDRLSVAARYMTEIVKGSLSDEDVPLDDFQFRLSEEDGKTFLRASAALPVEFSMMGAGLLSSVGVRDLNLSFEFGDSSARLALQSTFSRGAIGMMEEVLKNKDVTKIIFFLNNFNGANIRLKFADIESTITNLLAATTFNEKEQFMVTFLNLTQRLASSSSKDTDRQVYNEIIDQVLESAGASPDVLQYIQASYFATSCAKENLDILSSFSFVVGDEVFEATFNLPNLFEFLPSHDKFKQHNILATIPAVHVISDEDAAKLPRLKQWKKHEPHELSLKSKFLEWVDHYWCDECETFGHGWCYACTECMVVVHPEHLKNED